MRRMFCLPHSFSRIDSMKQRIFYLDLLRAWAIPCVVMLHCITPILANQGFYGSTSWHLAVALNEFCRTGVPLFLMISGALLLSDERSADIGYFYKKRLPRLIFPLLVWHTVYYLAYTFNSGGSFSLRDLLAGLTNNGSAYHMWFVYSLLGIYLITPFLRRITESCSMKALGVLLLILLFPGTLRPLWNVTVGHYIYLFDPLMECYLGYFLFGYLLTRVKLTKLLRILAIVCGIGGFLMGFLASELSSTAEALRYPFNGGYELNHYLLAGAIFFLLRDLTEGREIPAFPTKLAAVLSDTAFGVYWIHVLLLELAQRYLVPDASPILLAGLHFVAVM
ncbi:MAG: hypothetical protein E7632_08260, partial [Ruminococcaceae bacterium]|nr:hypothetical protein [Oscillospiraceae bacterium]